MNKRLANIFKGDKVIWMIFFFLCLVSIVEVFSASSLLTIKGESYWSPLIKHVGTIVMGIIAMVAVLNVPCKYFKVATFPMLGLSVLLLLIVLLFGQSTNGASRWLSLFGMQFQPSEIAKGTLVLAVAQILSAMQTEKGADKQAFWWVICTSLIIVVPILLENFSTAMLICIVIYAMMFIARVPAAQLGKLAGVVLIAGVIGVCSIMAFGKDNEQLNKESSMAEKTELVDGIGNEATLTANASTAVMDATPVAEGEGEAPSVQRHGILHRFDTWKSRIMKFLNNEYVAPKDYDLDKDAQVAHANIAIVQSNGYGRGPGNSNERDFLSQAFSDFIYAIIIEETGIEGAAIVAMLYVVIFFRAGRIARNCANTFPAYLAMGIGLLLVVQAMFNMMVAVGIAPVTGQPLPLISKGGTSTMINCVYIGMLLSISKSAKKREPKVQTAAVKA